MCLLVHTHLFLTQNHTRTLIHLAIHALMSVVVIVFFNLHVNMLDPLFATQNHMWALTNLLSYSEKVNAVSLHPSVNTLDFFCLHVGLTNLQSVCFSSVGIKGQHALIYSHSDSLFSHCCPVNAPLI